MNSKYENSRDLNILMVSPQPYYAPRGVLISIYTRLLALTKNNCKVHLVTFPLGENKIPANVKLTRIWNLPGINNIPVGPSLRKFLLDIVMWFYLLFHLITHHKNYNAIHCHEEAAIFSIPLASLFNLPLVYDYHSKLSEITAGTDLYNRKLLLAGLDYLQNWALRKASIIICVLPALANQLRKKLSRDKLYVIENLAPESLLDGSEIESPPDKFLIWGKSEDKFQLLYTGSFQGYQLMDKLLEGLSKATNKNSLKLLLVGGKPARRKNIEQLIANFELNDQVLLAGRLSTNELPPLLQNADVLVSPRGEGDNVPLKIFTYLWAGRPIMATDTQPHRSILEEDEAIWVQPDVEGFKKALETLPDLNLEELTRKSQEKFEQNYSYKRFLEKHQPYLDRLKQLADSND